MNNIDIDKQCFKIYLVSAVIRFDVCWERLPWIYEDVFGLWHLPVTEKSPRFEIRLQLYKIEFNQKKIWFGSLSWNEDCNCTGIWFIFNTSANLCIWFNFIPPPPTHTPFEYLKRNVFCPVCHTVRPSVCRYIFQNLI